MLDVYSYSSGMPTKTALSGLFVLKLNSLGKPGLAGVGAVFCFPFFKTLVVTAFGFDDHAGRQIFVDFYPRGLVTMLQMTTVATSYS